MVRRLLILSFLIIGCAAGRCDAARAEDGRGKSRPLFTYGIEWSYVSTFNITAHLNYISIDGPRVDYRYSTFGFIANGQLFANAGINVTEKVNLSLYLGYTGIYSGTGMFIPVSLRATRTFGKSTKAGRWLAYAEAGGGMNVRGIKKISFIGKVGGGYGIRLDRRRNLNFLISYQGVFTNPAVFEEEDMVSAERLRKSNAYISAFTLGIGLSF